MTRQKRTNFPKDGWGKATVRASRIFYELDYDKSDEVIKEYNNLNSESAKVIFARQVADNTAAQFNKLWPVAYKVLQIIKDNETYKWQEPNTVTYETFQEYFEDTFKGSFETWLELEEQYHFVADNIPGIVIERKEGDMDD